MILITGGKYQGKLEAASKLCTFEADDVLDFEKYCNKDLSSQLDIDLKNKKVWYQLEEYIRFLAKSNLSIEEITDKIIDLYENEAPKVAVISETGAGVVPLDRIENNFREAAGRVSIFLAEKSDRVYRVVCGLTMNIK